MATFALKCYVGPTAVKEACEELRTFAGFESVSEGTEHVYFTMSDEASHDAARDRAAAMLRFDGIDYVSVRKV